MNRLKVGIVGWRGMVGSVLMQRMREQSDFADIDVVFFSTSQVGQNGPVEAGNRSLADAMDIESLKVMDVILTCQGGDYTESVHPKLRESGWGGYWIDAASTLRMKDDSVLVLDPVNRDIIDAALAAGKKDLIGANCTVSTMLMSLSGLFKAGHVEWVSAMTYQAASGAGAKAMTELLKQMRFLGRKTDAMLDDPNVAILKLDQKAKEALDDSDFPAYEFGAPLASSLLPWIDKELDNGQSREEWKGMVETNKLLGTDENIAVDGTCVRIGAMRAHAHGLTIKLKKDISMEEIESLISNDHEWVKLIPNNKKDSCEFLTSAAVSGSLNVHVGRLRKMNIGGEYLNAFTVGDQLLWGAAEPLRRMLRILVERES